MRAKTVVAVVLAILLVIFSLQNKEPVGVKFLSFEKEIPEVLLIIGTFALGVLVGILASIRVKNKVISDEANKKAKAIIESSKVKQEPTSEK